MTAAIRIQNLSKEYRRGPTHAGSVRELFSRATNRLTRHRSCQLSHTEDGGSSTRGQNSNDRFRALEDVTFDVQPGEVVGIVGRNGAGKSTLLKILSRITDPTEGTIEINGRVASLLEVGTGFHGELTGRENVFLNGAILGMSRAEVRRKFDAIVEFSGVGSFIDTPVKRYSSGMYVRLAFAVAAHLDSEILIVDEVLSVGDLEFQRKCLGKMNAVAATGRTVLFVSHNMSAVRSLCQTGCLLEAGRLAVRGDLSQTLQEYYQRSRPEHEGHDSSLSLVETRVRRQKVFLDVAVLDKHDRQVMTIDAGGSLRIRLNLDTTAVPRNPVFTIGINDCTGNRILSLQSPHSFSATSRIGGRSEIECRIPWLPLAPGEYWLELVATDQDQHIDTVEVSQSLTVADPDACDDGYGVQHGVCVAASDWNDVNRDLLVQRA